MYFAKKQIYAAVKIAGRSPAAVKIAGADAAENREFG